MVMYTLIDIKEKGQGEFIRLILAEAQLQCEYVDKRVIDDEATTVKADSPTGSLPILDAAGTQIGETSAIARYLGSLYHLYGANAGERARIDQVLEVTLRLANYFHASYIKDEKLKASPMAAGMKSLRDYGVKRAPEMLAHLEKLLTKNGGDFFAGSKISIADLSAYFFFTFVAEHDSDFSAIYDKYPALKQHATRVAASPRIAAYLAQSS